MLPNSRSLPILFVLILCAQEAVHRRKARVLACEPGQHKGGRHAGKEEHKPASHTKTVMTGCPQKGDESGEFSITGQDGKTWELSSQSVKLDEHVGHQVTVTGSAHRESKAEEKAEEKKEGQMEKAASKNTAS